MSLEKLTPSRAAQVPDGTLITLERGLQGEEGYVKAVRRASTAHGSAPHIHHLGILADLVTEGEWALYAKESDLPTPISVAGIYRELGGTLLEFTGTNWWRHGKVIDPPLGDPVLIAPHGIALEGSLRLLREALREFGVLDEELLVDGVGHNDVEMIVKLYTEKLHNPLGGNF